MAKLQKIASIESFLPGSDEAAKTWGGQGRWSNRLSILWRSVGATDYRVRYVPSNEIFDEVGWWFAAVHLLAFGMGWNDIGLGLRRWREKGYPTEHPVLKTLADTFGPSIEALEIWFLNGSGDPIFHALQRHALFYFDRNKDALPARANANFDTDTGERRFLLQATGPRSKRAAEHFLGDSSDNLHLNSHFVGMLEHPFDINSLERGWLSNQATDWSVLKIVRIKNLVGLNQFFNRMQEELFEGLQMGQRLSVLLMVEDLALNLMFDLNIKTARWHLATPGLVDHWYSADAPNNWGFPLDA